MSIIWRSRLLSAACGEPPVPVIFLALMREKSHIQVKLVNGKLFEIVAAVDDRRLQGVSSEGAFGAETFGADIVLGDVNGAHRVDGHSETLRDRPDRKFRRPEQLYHAFLGFAFNPCSASPKSTVT